jgi:hypothetical protein
MIYNFYYPIYITLNTFQLINWIHAASCIENSVFAEIYETYETENRIEYKTYPVYYLEILKFFVKNSIWVMKKTKSDILYGMLLYNGARLNFC